MAENGEVDRIDRERAELLEEATRIVQAAEKAGRTVNAEEDARVLALMAQVRILEEQLGHFQRRHPEDEQTDLRSEDK